VIWEKLLLEGRLIERDEVEAVVVMAASEDPMLWRAGIAIRGSLRRTICFVPSMTTLTLQDKNRSIENQLMPALHLNQS
jgi:hypothetical protein